MGDGLNKYIGIGNLCEDPELRTTQGGQPVLHGRIAINGGYLDKDKVWKATCEYVNFTVWGNRATGLAKFLRKGKQICIEGALHTSSYDNREGQKVWKTEVNCTNVIPTGNKDSGGQEDGGDAGGGEEDAPPARSGGGGGGGYQSRGGGGQQRSGGGGGYGGGGGQRSGGGGGQQRSQGQGNTQRSQGGGGGGSGGRGGPPPPDADTQGDGGYGADDDIPFLSSIPNAWRP